LDQTIGSLYFEQEIPTNVLKSSTYKMQLKNAERSSLVHQTMFIQTFTDEELNLFLMDFVAHKNTVRELKG